MAAEPFALAKVLRLHPESNTADVMRFDDWTVIRNVAILCGQPVTTNTGLVDSPVPTPVDFDQELKLTKDRDMLACILCAPGYTAILGFVYPQVSQMLFQRENFRVSRHASDWYTTVNGNGDFEAYHPSGSFVRIAEDPAHEDLTGQDYDGKWRIANNTDRKPHLRVVLANGGETKLDLHADPDGNVNLVATGKLDANIAGDVSLETQGKVAATATGDVSVSTQGQATVASQVKVTVDAPLAHFTGDVQVDGNVAAAEDVTAANGTISVTNHVHAGVTSGGDDTAPPVPA